MAAFAPEAFILSGPRAPDGFGGGLAFLFVPFFTVGYLIAIFYTLSGVIAGSAFLGGAPAGLLWAGAAGLGGLGFESFGGADPTGFNCAACNC